jgi:HPt (histidine-containing phosphotransfer) domain-containing protein
MASSWSNETSHNTESNENKLLEIEILNSLKEFIGSEPFGQYLSEYINNTLSNIDRLGHAIASEDEERVKQFAHKLKGSAGNIGAMKLSTVCTEMQAMAHEENINAALHGQFEQIQKIYQETKSALSDYINELEQSELKVG